MKRIRYIGSREQLTPEQQAFRPPNFNRSVCEQCFLFDANKLLWEEEGYQPLKEYCMSCDGKTPVQNIEVTQLKFLRDLMNIYDARMVAHLTEAQSVCDQIDQTLKNIEDIINS
ncbi:hypothetical protein D6774_00905 [Candidatus Woesearchaeota archaeon]|nr:MAG: hypothetical protein D6774_00905 [Candidatus Woesearchaeota archaeon]